MSKIGLYNSQYEHDNCGVGFIANITGERSHSIVDKGLTILRRLIHRGAVGGDGKTGDGAGILTQIPHELFQQVAFEKNIELPTIGNYGVGMIFLPTDKSKEKKAIHTIEQSLNKFNISVLFWREVPINSSILGEIAFNSLPTIKQIFVSSKENKDLERLLYLTRKDIESTLYRNELSIEEFFISSFSTKTIVYKGMLVGAQTGEFYKDLQSKDYRSSIAVIHQRYSTNTFPSWALAQPFRMIAHNGEINTIKGNKNKMKVRENNISSSNFFEFEKPKTPIILPNISDSGSFDNVFELLVNSGYSMARSTMMMVPEPFGGKFHISQDLKDFYLYNASLMEPWDGPAAIVFSDGEQVGATLDRNGLRPARYTITKSGEFLLASETGVLEFDTKDVLKKGSLKPGEIVIVDTKIKRVRWEREIKSKESRANPYRQWIKKEVIQLPGLFGKGTTPIVNRDTLSILKTRFAYTTDDIEMIEYMATFGQEPIGSMGNDTPLPILMDNPQRIEKYFKQSFAQITNPPIDPYRENGSMSLLSFIGKEGNLLKESPLRCRQLLLEHPILSNDDIYKLCATKIEKLPLSRVDTAFEKESNLQDAIKRLQKKVEEEVKSGASIIVLTDRETEKGKLPIPSILSVAAVNTYLVEKGIRHRTGIVVETGDVIDPFTLSLLVGLGASAINPYTSLEIISNMFSEGEIEPSTAVDNYIKALKKGLLKIMSKMGVSTIRSYRGSALFETIGFNEELENIFNSVVNHKGSFSIQSIEKEIRNRENNISIGGLYRYKKDGVPHLFSPQVVKGFHTAITSTTFDNFETVAQNIHSKENVFFIRDKLKLNRDNNIKINNVEPIENIIKRFSGGAMSFGSLSKSAHETISVALNELGIGSNCGEGGEDKERGKSKSKSKIRQIASGRFGVTLDYIINAEELQIKIAQGAKPGEGGQLPGKKVTEMVAKMRGSVPGVTLISPPPHHDIYSIEDIAQLIYDIRSVNENAKISVKLVAQAGVGTVAAGVVKAGADSIVISGHDGGTGASPLTSMFTTGTPWELGLAETNQTLILNNFRDKVELQVDGKLVNGEDIVKAAILGANRFGIATTLLLSIGCVMCRNCHKGNCSVGIATQDPKKETQFKGTVEDVKHFITYLAEDTRRVLASIGKKSIDEIIGETSLLKELPSNLDLSPILTKVENNSQVYLNNEISNDKELCSRLQPAIEKGVPMEIDSTISNMERSVGTALSSKIYRNFENNLPQNTIKCNFTGYAGQSFGAFLNRGITFRLEGEANDYIAKGLNGGKIIITPPRGSNFRAHNSTIAGNVALFGATEGELYINGVAGERFAVRNSGAKAVVCGVGNHCCEYMTGGTVVVLDKTGTNFGAGMSGGFAYVLDEDQLFDTRCNLERIELNPVEYKEDIAELKQLITNHANLTGSHYSARILEDWEEMLPLFVKVTPIEYKKALARRKIEESYRDDNLLVTEEVEE